jgi:hypothetical protein
MPAFELVKKSKLVFEVGRRPFFSFLSTREAGGEAR